MMPTAMGRYFIIATWLPVCALIVVVIIQRTKHSAAFVVADDNMDGNVMAF